MLKLTENEIDISDSSVLFSKPFTQKSFESYWEIASGSWHVEKGWLAGLLRENAGGMLFTKVGFPGNILLDFHARTVPPCANDIIFVWNAEGWDYAKMTPGLAISVGWAAGGLEKSV